MPASDRVTMAGPAISWYVGAFGEDKAANSGTKVFMLPTTACIMYTHAVATTEWLSP